MFVSVRQHRTRPFVSVAAPLLAALLTVLLASTGLAQQRFYSPEEIDEIDARYVAAATASGSDVISHLRWIALESVASVSREETHRIRDALLDVGPDTFVRDEQRVGPETLALSLLGHAYLETGEHELALEAFAVSVSQRVGTLWSIVAAERPDLETAGRLAELEGLFEAARNVRSAFKELHEPRAAGEPGLLGDMRALAATLSVLGYPEHASVLARIAGQ